MERREARDMEEERGVVGDVGGSRGTRGRVVNSGGIVLVNKFVLAMEGKKGKV